MKINEEDWYPIYLNPTPQEITELGESLWDTIRVLFIDDQARVPGGPYICIASGYGNTHTTLAHALRKHFHVSRGLFTTPAILFFDHDKHAMFNACDMGGPDKVSARRALAKYCSEWEADVLRAVIEARELVLV